LPQQRSASIAPEKLPFTVAVSENFTDGAQPMWISPHPPSKAPPRPNEIAPYDEWATWAERARAVLTQQRAVYFTVQGTSDAQVTLLDLQVQVVARRPAMRGTLYGLSGGDPSHFRAVNADLDREPPALSDRYNEEFFTSEFPKRHERRPMRFPYRVSLSDAETFLVDAFAKNCDCAFVIKLSWAAQGRTGTHIIDDGGSPFRVTGNRNATQICMAPAPGALERCSKWP
jgi:hypothetical protein